MPRGIVGGTIRRSIPPEPCSGRAGHSSASAGLAAPTGPTPDSYGPMQWPRPGTAPVNLRRESHAFAACPNSLRQGTSAPSSMRRSQLPFDPHLVIGPERLILFSVTQQRNRIELDHFLSCGARPNDNNMRQRLGRGTKPGLLNRPTDSDRLPIKLVRPGPVHRPDDVIETRRGGRPAHGLYRAATSLH